MPQLSILVIDDEAIWHKLLQSLLRPMGYAIYSAATGADGVRLAEQHKPDCILLDFHLADGDAVAVCSALKAGGGANKIPVIIVSSDPAAELAAYAECKAECFVLKGPRWLKCLLAALDSVLPPAGKA